MYFRTLSVIALLTMISACATKPSFVAVAHDPLLDRGDGTILVVDVCVKRNVLVGTDYALVSESKKGAQALADASRKYLESYGVRMHAVLIPFVCGAQQPTSNPPYLVADQLDGPPRQAQPPFAVADELTGDPEYLHALAQFSASTFQRPRLPKETVTAGKRNSQQPLVSMEDMRAAVAAIAARTHASAVLYLGVNGLSQSTGKKVAQRVAGVLIGMATGAATLGITGSHGVGIIPGPTPDSWVMSASLVNLGNTQIVWSEAVKAYGDPLKADVISQSGPIDLLFSSLVRRDSSTWTPPGAPPTR